MWFEDMDRAMVRCCALHLRRMAPERCKHGTEVAFVWSKVASSSTREWTCGEWSNYHCIYQSIELSIRISTSDTSKCCIIAIYMLWRWDMAILLRISFKLSSLSIDNQPIRWIYKANSDGQALSELEPTSLERSYDSSLLFISFLVGYLRFRDGLPSVEGDRFSNRQSPMDYLCSFDSCLLRWWSKLWFKGYLAPGSPDWACVRPQSWTVVVRFGAKKGSSRSVSQAFHLYAKQTKMTLSQAFVSVSDLHSTKECVTYPTPLRTKREAFISI